MSLVLLHTRSIVHCREPLVGHGDGRQHGEGAATEGRGYTAATHTRHTLLDIQVTTW